MMRINKQMSHDTNFFLLYFKDKIPKDSLIFLKESLEKASEEQKEKLLFTKLKNPLYGLLFAFLLPGLDRIYNGNIILGILKIISAILVSIGLIIAEDKNDESTMLIFINLFFILSVWVILDYFLVWKDICQNNLKKIFEVL